MVINAVDAALEDREEVFSGVGMPFAAHPFIVSVIDDLMRGVLWTKPRVGLERVRDDRG
jgi:hypothetical protein